VLSLQASFDATTQLLPSTAESSDKTQAFTYNTESVMLLYSVTQIKATISSDFVKA